jgi:hypothetical protein
MTDAAWKKWLERQKQMTDGQKLHQIKMEKRWSDDQQQKPQRRWVSKADQLYEDYATGH